MPLLRSFPENADLGHVFNAFPAPVKHLLDYHDVLLRGESTLSIAERELIAAFVSGLNECQFCMGHIRIAEAFGLEEGLLEGLLDDIETARVPDKLKPILHYVKKLTQTPSRMTQRDADAIFDAGWDEQAFHDAIATCALFNFMNRLVEGFGIKPDYQRAVRVPKEALRGITYNELAKRQMEAAAVG